MKRYAGLEMDPFRPNPKEMAAKDRDKTRKFHKRVADFLKIPWDDFKKLSEAQKEEQCVEFNSRK